MLLNYFGPQRAAVATEAFDASCAPYILGCLETKFPGRPECPFKG